MHVASYCPTCSKAVSFEDKTCPHCESKLTKAKFTFGKIACGGAIGLLVAIIISAIAVPLTVIIIIASFFMRERLHITRLDDGPPPQERPPTGRVVETEGNVTS